METQARIAALVGRPDGSVTLAVTFPADGGLHTQIALLTGAPDEPSIEVEAVLPEAVRALAAAPSGQRYAVTAEGQLWSDQRGGWARVAAIGGALHGVTSPTDEVIVVCGDEGRVTRLHIDGSATPTDGASDEAPADLLAIAGSEAMGVVAVGRGGRVLRYDGARWERLDAGTEADLYGVAVGRRSVLVAGDRGALRLFVEGAWTSFDEEAPARRFHDVAVAEGQIFVAAGREGLWLLEEDALVPILDDVPCEHLAVAGELLFAAGELGLGFLHEDTWQAIHLATSD